jgi:hypothetical protein
MSGGLRSVTPCGEEFILGYSPQSVHKRVAEKQAKWHEIFGHSQQNLAPKIFLCHGRPSITGKVEKNPFPWQ